MVRVFTPRAEVASEVSADSNPDVERDTTEVLFPEAKRRERHRRLIVSTTVVVAVGLAAGLIGAFGGSPPRNTKGTTTPGNGESSVGIVGHFTFRGDGIGAAQFSQAESVAIAELKEVLGSPTTSRPSTDAGNCTVDAYLDWPTMAAYFLRGRFVGYDSGNLRSGWTGPHVVPNASTAAGLRVGDTLAQAQSLYGKSLVVLFSQGGSWRVTTSTGLLRGYLTAVPYHPTPPVPRIADISAGSVGCPAESP